jgi:hypothetical protein
MEFSAAMKSMRHCALRLQREGGGQLLFARARLPGRGDGVELVHQCGGGALQELLVLLLDRIHAGRQFRLGGRVAGLAGAVDVAGAGCAPSGR